MTRCYNTFRQDAHRHAHLRTPPPFARPSQHQQGPGEARSGGALRISPPPYPPVSPPPVGQLVWSYHQGSWANWLDLICILIYSRSLVMVLYNLCSWRLLIIGIASVSVLVSHLSETCEARRRVTSLSDNFIYLLRRTREGHRSPDHQDTICAIFFFLFFAFHI